MLGRKKKLGKMLGKNVGKQKKIGKNVGNSKNVGKNVGKKCWEDVKKVVGPTFFVLHARLNLILGRALLKGFGVCFGI